MLINTFVFVYESFTYVDKTILFLIKLDFFKLII